MALRSTPNQSCKMLYKFKSKAAGDLIMLEPNGRRVLEIIGKEAGHKGIVLPAEMPGAIAALEAAIAQDEAERQPPPEDDEAPGDAAGQDRSVSLRQRAVPFLEMLRRCERAGHEIVWGV